MEKSYRLIIHGDDMYDKGYVKTIIIEAETLKEAMEIALDQNGVYDVEPAEDYKEELFNVECVESGVSDILTLDKIKAFIEFNRKGNSEWVIKANYILNEENGEDD